MPLTVALWASLSAGPTWAEQASNPTQSWDISQLMLNLRQVKAATNRFVESKTLHMLKEPLVTSGTLLYVAPDQVEKITLSPQRERLAVKGDTLTLEGGPENRTRVVSLKEHPEIEAIVEGIRATLAGDLPMLRRFYVVNLRGDDRDWQLLLEAKEPALKKFVESIRIIGSRNAIRTVETAEADGDHSEMRIVEATQ
jgi:hypothetical protein